MALIRADSPAHARRVVKCGPSTGTGRKPSPPVHGCSTGADDHRGQQLDVKVFDRMTRGRAAAPIPAPRKDPGDGSFLRFRVRTVSAMRMGGNVLFSGSPTLTPDGDNTTAIPVTRPGRRPTLRDPGTSPPPWTPIRECLEVISNPIQEIISGFRPLSAFGRYAPLSSTPADESGGRASTADPPPVRATGRVFAPVIRHDPRPQLEEVSHAA